MTGITSEPSLFPASPQYTMGLKLTMLETALSCQMIITSLHLTAVSGNFQKLIFSVSIS